MHCSGAPHLSLTRGPPWHALASVEELHTHLREVRQRCEAGAVPLDRFIITKQLTKRPEEYPDAKSQPHVQVALRRRESGAVGAAHSMQHATHTRTHTTCVAPACYCLFPCPPGLLADAALWQGLCSTWHP
jgi:hypothetical protein